LEDDLMRIFGSERMETLLAHKKVGLREGEALTHPWISKILERAQAKVEAMNFDVRKNLLKFDNVMNDQRKVIYDQRREIMEANDVHEYVEDMRNDLIEDLVHRCIPNKSYAEQWDMDTLENEVQRLFNLELPVKDWAKEEGIAEAEILERVQSATDHKMAAKSANTGPEVYKNLEKALFLQKLDQCWKEHLLNLDHLRQGINLRAYGQRDPLNEYKAEAFGMFEAMLDQLREGITETLSFVEFNVDADAGQLLMRREENARLQETRVDPATLRDNMRPKKQNVGYQADKNEPFTHQKTEFDENNPQTWGKVQRNAACPCGSGKKFKHCHGKIGADA